VQSATTATTLFVMSTSTCLAFLVEGTAPPDYAEAIEGIRTSKETEPVAA